MLHPNAKLVANVFDEKIEKKPTRDGFGKGVLEAGKKDKNVVVLCADLAESTRAEWFKKEFPERYIEIGVAEQNLATVASGMAAAGKIPFIASYAAFSPGRNYEQIRTTIALNHQPVKICGMHAGVSVGPDGATHQMLEDIGLMRMLPNMVVLVPADAEEARKATYAAAFHDSPAYLRFGRSGTPLFTTPETPFEIGKAYRLFESAKPRVALIGAGPILHEALRAARALDAEGVGSIVLNLHTIKPLDAKAVVEAARAAGAVVTLEEHQVMGGVGSAIAECLAEEYPVPISFIGVRDRFGQSGEPEELFEEYGLTGVHIAEVVRALAGRSR